MERTPLFPQTAQVCDNTTGLTVQSGDFAGSIDSTNTGGLTKTGTGTLTLAGSNAYTGPTRIDAGAGTLALSGGGTLGATSLLDLRDGHLDISGITPAFFSLPNLDMHGPANLNIGTKTADFSGKTLSFYVPSNMNAGDTLLSVSGAGTTDISNSTVRVGIAGSSSPLGAGDAITLIDTPDGTLQGDPANKTSKGEGMQGVTLLYQFDLDKSDKRLTATVAGAPKADPRAKALSESFLAGLALNLQGAASWRAEAWTPPCGPLSVWTTRKGTALPGSARFPAARFVTTAARILTWKAFPCSPAWPGALTLNRGG